MSNSNKISIIIPIYNNELLLERCLKSIQAQTFENIEVIMINDGSLDNSENICLSFVKEDERFKYYFQNNAGVSAARNYGLSVKSGEYYTFVDSDDWIEPQYCQKMFDTILYEQSDMVFCGINYVVDGKKLPQREIGMNKIISNFEVEHFLIGHPQHVLGSCWRVLYKSSKFEGIRFNEKLYIYEDLIYLLTCISYSNGMSYVNSQLYNYDLPEVQYFKKYYRDNILDVCYNVGKLLYDILVKLGRNEWASAELFKEYCLAVNWLCSVDCEIKLLFKTLKNHKLSKEFAIKSNYTAYKKLYKLNSLSSKFILWLQLKKYNMFLYKCKTIKKKLRNKNA
ncbi:MAG: glycosyltransferase [Clostridia bacterium]|nr:glycosyltransferase [Clostridia bacterium]